VHKTRDDHEGHTETYDEWHRKSHDIFKFEQIVHQFVGGYIPAGQYVFPFAFKLPDNCPSSAYFTGTNSGVGKIKYSCKGVFKAEDNTDIANIKYKCPVIIREMHFSEPASLKSVSVEEIKK